MWFKIKDILIILSMHSMVWTQDMNFCEQFSKNNEIDFGYQHQMAGYYLFIDSYYWRLIIDDISKSVEFHSLDTNSRNDRFDKSYGFAISGKLCEQNPCTGSPFWSTGVYNKHKESIEWFELESNSLDFELVSKNDSVLNFTDSSLKKLDIKPVLGFHTIFNYKIQCLLQQIYVVQGIDEYYSRTYRCLTFYSQDLAVNRTNTVLKRLIQEMENNGQTITDNTTILNNIKDMREVIAIFEANTKYVFLHKEDKVITYCFTQTELFQKGCDGTGVKTLIDCSKTPTPSNTTTEESNSTVESIINEENTTNDYTPGETFSEESTESLVSTLDTNTTEISSETSSQLAGLPIDDRFTETEDYSSVSEDSQSDYTSERSALSLVPKGSTALLWLSLVTMFVIIGFVLFLVYAFIINRQKKTSNQTPKEVPKVVVKK